MINVLCYVGIFSLEALISHWYFSKLFALRRSTLVVTIWIVVAHILLFGLSRLNNFMVNTVAFTLANALIMAIGYRCGLKNILLHSLLMNCICTGTELLVNVWLTFIYGNFFEFYDNNVALILLCALSKLLYFFVMAMFAYWMRGIQHPSNEKGPVIILLAIVPTVSMLTLLVMFHVFGAVTLRNSDIILLSIVAFALVIANVAVFLAYDYLQQLMRTSFKTELALSREQANNEYYHMLDEQYEAQRILIHDMKHHLSVLRQEMQNENFEGAAKYVEKLFHAPELNSKTKWCNNPTLNIILRYYQTECNKTGIDFSVGVRANAIDFMEPADITALFGNALQNALEASVLSEDKVIELSINCLEPSENIVVVISNSCHKSPTMDADGNWLTTKADHGTHGIGMRSIRSIAAKYQGDFYSQYNEEKRRFELRMIFYHNKVAP